MRMKLHQRGVEDVLSAGRSVRFLFNLARKKMAGWRLVFLSVLSKR
uniref:Uncharacterized protein n=1 Tax=Moniliophthora roreri TaxID=221103 RepID=A0A0W0GFS1_MONRR